MLETLFKFQKQKKRRNEENFFASRPASGTEDTPAGQAPPTGPPGPCYSVKSNNIQFDHVITAWLDASSAKFKRSTYSTYATVADRHIRPQLGRYGVSDLTAEILGTFLKEKSYGREDEKPLAASTVCSIVTVLRASLRYAETMGCAVAAAGALNRPKLVTAETEILTGQEQERLEAYLRRDSAPERLGVLVCLYTGLRLGEICALKWGDISLDAGTLTVRRTVQRIRNAAFAETGKAGKTVILFDAPKSRRSNRSIPLPSFLLDILRDHKRADNCFFLTGDPVSFIEPRSFQNRFKAMLRMSGLRDINFHALRHTFATNCVNLGFDVKTLSEILGHADVSVTLNTYVHPSLAVMRSYMERLGGDSETEKRNRAI